MSDQTHLQPTKLTPTKLQPSKLAKAHAPELVNRDKEMIPSVLLKAMAMLAVCSLVIVAYATFTDRPLTGVPAPAPVVAEREIVVTSDKFGAVEIHAPDGTLISAMSERDAGFVSVVARGLKRERMLHNVAETETVWLRSYENGRLSLQDAATGWSVELASFGKDNKAAWARLLPATDS